jgi:hypothetical protein
MLTPPMPTRWALLPGFRYGKKSDTVTADPSFGKRSIYIIIFPFAGEYNRNFAVDPPQRRIKKAPLSGELARSA